MIAGSPSQAYSRSVRGATRRRFHALDLTEWAAGGRRLVALASMVSAELASVDDLQVSRNGGPGLLRRCRATLRPCLRRIGIRHPYWRNLTRSSPLYGRPHDHWTRPLSRLKWLFRNQSALIR